MMNMEWSILPGYAREEEIRELFTEYTNMVLAGDPAFAGYLARQHYEDELAHPARKYAPPHGRLYLVCTGSTPVAAPRSRRWMTPAARWSGCMSARNTAARALPGAGAPADAGGPGGRLPPDGTGYLPLPAGRPSLFISGRLLRDRAVQ